MVRAENSELFYKRLREAVSVSSSFPLLIFPSTSDVDSVCALKLFTRILRLHCVLFSVYPVSSHSEIHDHPSLKNRSSADLPITVLLINWGCQQDLRKILNLGHTSRIFVIDSHRPIHLHNLSKYNEQVIVAYTLDDEQQGDLAYDFDISALADACDLDSSNEMYEKSQSDDSESEEDGDSNGMRKRRKVMKEYNMGGSSSGKAAGCFVFDISFSARTNTKECLWLACLSLTDQMVHNRLTDERYHAEMMKLEQSIGNVDVSNCIILKDGIKVRAPESCRITCEDKPRLMLLHGWTLFESMLCSPYIATKLKTWRDNGKKKLNLLLARMGFPLIDCQQKFCCISLKLKTTMRDRLEEFLPEYGLTELFHRCFVLLDKYNPGVPAPDVVYSVTALLESPQGFWVAYEALSLKNMDKQRMGMEIAIGVQKAIVRQVSKMRDLLRKGVKFRWVKLEDSVAKVLGYPQALTRCGNFFLDALKEMGAEMKPFICICPSQNLNKLLIVGLCGKPRLGCVKGNVFGVAFKEAAAVLEIQVEVLHDSSWIVIDKSDLKEFIAQLTFVIE